MIVDTHVHVYPPEIVTDWRRIAQREPYFDKLTQGRAHRWADADDVLRAMDEDGVEQSWICGFAFSDIALCRLVNDYVLEQAARSNGRLRALCVVPPLAKGLESEIERCAERGAIGVGELFPDGQDWAIDEIRETWRVVGLACERGMFVLIHAAEPVGRPYPGKGTQGPRATYALACNHPEASFVLAHWGGGLFQYESMPDVRAALANVWYDTAAAPFLYTEQIFLSASAIVPEKLLYGSDFPLLRYPRYAGLVEAAGIARPQAEALFSGNAEKMLCALAKWRGQYA